MQTWVQNESRWERREPNPSQRYDTTLLSSLAAIAGSIVHGNPHVDETHTISHSGGPQFMLMNLVNENGDESKHWQMVQIAKSYNVRTEPWIAVGDP